MIITAIYHVFLDFWQFSISCSCKTFPKWPKLITFDRNWFNAHHFLSRSSQLSFSFTLMPISVINIHLIRCWGTRFKFQEFSISCSCKTFPKLPKSITFDRNWFNAHHFLSRSSQLSFSFTLMPISVINIHLIRCWGTRFKFQEFSVSCSCKKCC